MGTVEERLGLVEIQELRKRVWAMKDVFVTLSRHLYDRYDAAIREVWEKYSDAEILADPELLRFLVTQDGMDSKANQRKREILWAPLKGTKLRADGGIDGREGYYGLPVMETWLTCKQDVQAEVNAAEEWAKLFLFERPDLSIRVMERTLSEGGRSVSVLWTPETGQATVRTNSYADHGEGCYTGTLDGALAYVAEHEWYEGGPTRDDDDDRYDY